MVTQKTHLIGKELVWALHKMEIESSVLISKEKLKTIIKLSCEEFVNGSWLEHVPVSRNTDVHYVARTNVLIIIDTPKLNITKREV